jgi:hypothetical protein
VTQRGLGILAEKSPHEFFEATLLGTVGISLPLIRAGQMQDIAFGGFGVGKRRGREKDRGRDKNQDRKRK